MSKSIDDIFRNKKGRVAHIISPKQKLNGIANRLSEAVIKIDKASTGIKTQVHMQKAASYIARDGKIELEDENGNTLNLNEVKEKVSLWCDIQDVPYSKNELTIKRSADARRMLISCPKDTNVDDFKQAIREFAEKELKSKGFAYMFAIHHRSDTFPDEPEHPHAHILIKSISDKDKRLNLRKNDLRILRERFVEIAKKYSINLNATPRSLRGVIQKSIKQSRLHQELRGDNSHEFSKVREQELIEAIKTNSTVKSHFVLDKAKENRKELIKNIDSYIKELRNSQKEEDLDLATKLQDYYKSLRPAKSAQELKLIIAKRKLKEKSLNKNQTQAQKWAIERKKKSLKTHDQKVR